MLRCIEELRGYTIQTDDGDIGRSKDLLFDQRHWGVRYLVVDTGSWLPGRKVVVPTALLGHPDWQQRRFPVHMTREQLEQGPSLAEHEPVSRHFEQRLFGHFGYAYLGVGPDLWSAYAAPITQDIEVERARRQQEMADEDRILRSAHEVAGYHIAATDGEIGHVEDLVLDEERWQIRYIVVDTRNWLPGRKVIIDRDWVTDIDWHTASVTVDHSREAVRESPEFDPRAPINRAYEERLYDWYGRPKYWDSEIPWP